MCCVGHAEDHESARQVPVPEYTVLTVCAVLAVVVAELVYFRSGIFRTAQYWWSIVIRLRVPSPGGWLAHQALRSDRDLQP